MTSYLPVDPTGTFAFVPVYGSGTDPAAIPPATALIPPTAYPYAYAQQAGATIPQQATYYDNTQGYPDAYDQTYIPTQMIGTQSFPQEVSQPQYYPSSQPPVQSQPQPSSFYQPSISKSARKAASSNSTTSSSAFASSRVVPFTAQNYLAALEDTSARERRRVLKATQELEAKQQPHHEARRARTPLPAPKRDNTYTQKFSATTTSNLPYISNTNNYAASYGYGYGYDSSNLAPLPAPIITRHGNLRHVVSKGMMERKHRGTSRNVLGGFYTS